MRTIALFGTAAATAIVIWASLAVPANADRMCRRVCEDGFCRTRCVERHEGLRLHLFDRDRDFDRDRRFHHRGGDEFRGPGVDVDIGR